MTGGRRLGRQLAGRIATKCQLSCGPCGGRVIHRSEEAEGLLIGRLKSLLEPKRRLFLRDSSCAFGNINLSALERHVASCGGGLMFLEYNVSNSP
jgi:hypothetical protein